MSISPTKEVISFVQFLLVCFSAGLWKNYRPNVDVNCRREPISILKKIRITKRIHIIFDLWKRSCQRSVLWVLLVLLWFGVPQAQRWNSLNPKSLKKEERLQHHVNTLCNFTPIFIKRILCSLICHMMTNVTQVNRVVCP